MSAVEGQMDMLLAIAHIATKGFRDIVFYFLFCIYEKNHWNQLLKMQIFENHPLNVKKFAIYVFDSKIHDAAENRLNQVNGRWIDHCTHFSQISYRFLYI